MSYARVGEGTWTAIVLVIVLAIGLFGAWYAHKHPCIKWQEYTCTRCSLEVYISDDKGNITPICMSYEDTTCSRCVERKP